MLLLLVRAHELFLVPELWKGEAKISVVPLAIRGKILFDASGRRGTIFD